VVSIAGNFIWLVFETELGWYFWVLKKEERKMEIKYM